VGIAIVGCGLIGQKRAAAAAALGWPVTAVFDVDAGRAAALAAARGARVCVALEELLAGDDVEAVVIATCHDSLAALALAAVEAGKHVLLEKPAARNAAELQPVVEVVAQRPVAVRVGFNHRFHPALRQARELVDAGALGPLMYIRARYGHGARLGYEKEWRMDPALSGGGELIDQGMHLIDLSRWFLGEFSHVTGFAPTYYWNCAADDNAFLALHTAAGQVAWLHASCTEWKNLFSFEIFGHNGKLQIDGLGGSYGVEKLTFYRMLPAMGPPETTSWEYPFRDDSWERETAEFRAAIAGRAAPGGTLADALAALRIVDQVYGGPRT